MPRRDRIVAMITLALLNVFTVSAGVAVSNLTPERELEPSPPAVAQRELIAARSPASGGVDPGAPVPSAGTLGSRLTGLLATPGAKINAVVIDAATRKTLFSQRGDLPATPASTTKLVTSAAALAALGPDHQITTKVVRGQDGSVVLVGGGDPTLTARPIKATTYPKYASLADLARQTAAAVKASGGTKVRVDYDSSLYRGPAIAAGWKSNYLPDGEVAPLSALTVDEGRIGEGEKQRVADPAGTAATTFARLLGRYGVTAKKGRRASAAGGTQIAAVSSPPISVLIEHLMTASDNDVAEAVARQVAIKRGRPASFAGGAQAVRETLAELGVDNGVRVNDGSGLSTLNAISPLALATVVSLAASADHPELRAAITGMPVAGFSGTLATRYTAPPTQTGAGLVRAKTGTIAGVSTLAGIAYDADGRLLAFAFMANDIKPNVDAPSMLDRLAATVAGCGCS